MFERESTVDKAVYYINEFILNFLRIIVDIHDDSLSHNPFSPLYQLQRRRTALCEPDSCPREKGVMDRCYQCHEKFDLWQEEEKLCLCRIKAKTLKTVIESHPVAYDSIVFYDAVVIIVTAGINQTKESLRLVGYEIDTVKYWIAANRYDFSAEQVAVAYNLR